MAFFKYGATVNIKKQASLDIIAKDVPEVSHTADKISAKKDDNFVYFWTRAVSADVPNLNSDLFPLDELKKAYPTFIGRGLYMDHNAQSVANAVGKVFDAKLLEDPTATEEEGRYYVGCLCGVDKTTHPDIAAKVAHGVIDSVSMGASCGSCQCNICNRVCHTPEEFCVHLQHQGQIDPETGKKCISINRDVNFSELSLVGVPADPMAKMQQVFAEFVGGLNKSASLEKEAENSFLEKFSFSIPCGNEKICETLFNVLTGYKKQGISDLSMDGSILKLSVEAKNEDLAKQKLEKISEEQGLGVEQPLEKEENLMPKEEIKPVEEQVEKKDEVFSQDVIQKCKELDEQYDDQENYVMFEIVDNNIKDYYKVPSELIYDQVSKPNMYIYLDGKLLTVKEYLEVSEGPVDDSKSESAKKENIDKKADEKVASKEEKLSINKKAEDKTEYSYSIKKVTVPYRDAFKYKSVKQGLKETVLGGDYGDIYFNPSNVDFTNDSIILNDVTLVSYWVGVGVDAEPEDVAAEIFSDALDSTSLYDALNVSPRYVIENNPEEFEEELEPTVSQETITKYKERGFVEEGTPEYDEFYNAGFTLKKSLIPGEDGKALYNVVELESSKKENIEKKADSEEENLDSFDYLYSQLVNGNITEYKQGVNKLFQEGPAKVMEYMDWMEEHGIDSKEALKVMKNASVKTDLQEVESSKTQSNEVKEVKAEENKETKKEDLVPGVSKEDTKKAIEHDLAKEKEEAKGGEDETKDIETLEKAIKETDKGALSKVIDLLKKFIGGEAKEGEDLKDYKSDDLVKKLEEKPADKKASIEEPVNNVVNTVAEPVMDHIDAKPEVPAQPVPEVKEEVEDKKEEVKPSKDVKTKEDAVNVLEDVLKAGEEADVKELGKVLDFLKSDKKEEKKEDVKEEKVEEKKAEVEEDMEKKADFDPTVSNEDLESVEKRDEVETQLNKRLLEIMEEAEQYGIDTQKLLSEPNGLSNILKELEEMKSYSHDVESSKTQSNEVKEVKAEAKPLFANVTRVSLLKTANLIDSKWVFHFKGTDKVACLSVKNLLPGVSEKVAYLTSKEFYNEMMDTLTKKQAFDGEAVKQIVANYNEKIKVGSDEAKSQVSKATSKAKNETDGKKVSDTSKAVDTKLTDDGKAQKQDKVNSKEDAGAIESATKKAPAETDIKVSAELEAKCKQLTAALEAKEAEVSQMKMQQELAAKTAKARQIVEKSIKCGLVQCNETFRQEELLKQASPLKAKEEAMKRTADSMVADLLALSDEELDKQASYLSNFKVEAEVKQLKPIKIEASCEQSEDEDLIKALGAEMW